MNEWSLLGALMTLMYLLDYCIKPRLWRTRIGIAMMVFGVFAIFKLPFLIDEIEILVAYIITCIYGWSLFYNSDRFEQTD